MSRTDFFLVVSAETVDGDVDDPGYLAGIATCAAGGVANDPHNGVTGRVVAQVIDVRSVPEATR